MALLFDLNESLINGQIKVVRQIMRLPKLSPKERLYLSELLKMLYIFRNELEKPEKEMNKQATMTWPELMEIKQYNETIYKRKISDR